MYEMTTGKRPFSGDTPIAVIDAVLHNDPEPASKINSSVSKPLAQIIAKALQKDRDQRYRTASEMREEAARLINSQ